jgi:hypothetical protein
VTQIAWITRSLENIESHESRVCVCLHHSQTPMVSTRSCGSSSSANAETTAKKVPKKKRTVPSTSQNSIGKKPKNVGVFSTNNQPKQNRPKLVNHPTKEEVEYDIQIILVDGSASSA